MPISDRFRPRILAKLRLLYDDRAEAVLDKIDRRADRHEPLRAGRGRRDLWDERSVVLITYGDQISREGQPSLQVLKQFLLDYDLHRSITAVHILPFFPYSSDDGFSVIDYRQVDPALGSWEDVDSLGQSFGLMFDFVINHCSQQHDWFQRYLRQEEPYRNHFIDIDPTADLSAVTRPRSTPLLTPFETNTGTKHVWTTFSADQVDLNFASPDVLVDMLDILLLYVGHGARVIRLDAIGFLWKTVGTSCMHLPQTHAVVKLMRDLLDDLAPGTILLTETNVPHEENVSYFGARDEAHAVYQFSLAPLLLDAFLAGDATPLNRWLADLEQPGPGMAFLNFTASHDGIGVRPLEGLIGPERLTELVEGVRRRGGLVSTRRNPDGSDSPYELNVAYFSALDSVAGLPPDIHARKFLASQGVMLALRGVPGIYFHSLVGTANDTNVAGKAGHNRAINRRKFEDRELRRIVEAAGSASALVFAGYRNMLAVRCCQAAFHPNASQTTVATRSKALIAFTRTSLDAKQTILVLANVGDSPVEVDLPSMVGTTVTRELVSGRPVADNSYTIEPYGIAWLA